MSDIEQALVEAMARAFRQAMDKYADGSGGFTVDDYFRFTRMAMADVLDALGSVITDEVCETCGGTGSVDVPAKTYQHPVLGQVSETVAVSVTCSCVRAGHAGRTSPRKLRESVEDLYWFVKMVESGGPDGTELDTQVYEDGIAAARALAPLFRELPLEQGTST